MNSQSPKKIHIHTFGCQQNVADSERFAGYYRDKGYRLIDDPAKADIVLINTCMVREQAEEKIYGFAKKMKKLKKINPKLKIIVTGCLVGTAKRDKTGFFPKRLQERLNFVDKIVESNEIGYENDPLRFQTSPTNTEDLESETHAWVNISNGCSNYCSFCIVPFARGPEVSRPIEDILREIRGLIKSGYDRITLLGQNVNSYGSDLKKLKMDNGKGTMTSQIHPAVVDSMGKKRLPTLFPFLLEQVCQFKELKKISFMSSNPWDFTDELIDVIAKYSQIDRTLHLPLQSGDDDILKRMRRFYTKQDYLNLIDKIKQKVPDVIFTTDIIVGFPGETERSFQNSVDVATKVNFQRAYIARYSERKGTHAAKNYKDDISQKVKRERFHILDKVIHGAK